MNFFCEKYTPKREFFEANQKNVNSEFFKNIQNEILKKKDFSMEKA